MGLGTFTKIKFRGEGIEQIYEYAKNAVETDFFDRVFHNNIDWAKALDEEYEKWAEIYGVTSLCQGYSYVVDKDDNELELEIYSVYDTPVGVWKKIAEDFPKIKARGEYYREENIYDKAGIKIEKGKAFIEQINDTW